MKTTPILIRMLNCIILQWFFIRLERRRRIVLSISNEPMISKNNINKNRKRYDQCYRIEGWVLPFTKNNFKIKAFSYRITKLKVFTV